MNMKACKYLALAVLLFTATVPAHAGDKSAKEAYELGEQCGKQAAQIFTKENGTGIEGSEKEIMMLSNYENHYNRKLNKCFYLLTSVLRDAEGRSGAIKYLRDINENKKYGSVSSANNQLMNCDVLGKRCHSEDEWNSLIAPYMNE